MKNRSKTSFKFPYKKFKGADQPIFDAAIADKLGINYTKGELRYTLVGDGSYIPIFLNTLPVKLGPVSFRAQIGFCTHLGAEINLIGQEGFFDRFDITFSKSKKIITFQRV